MLDKLWVWGQWQQTGQELHAWACRHLHTTHTHTAFTDLFSCSSALPGEISPCDFFLSFYLETISNLPKLAKIKTIQRMAIYPLTRSLTFYSIGYISTHVRTHTNTATAKSRQSCPTLCDPIDSSPPGSPVPGILQARTPEWVAISFSNAGK